MNNVVSTIILPTCVALSLIFSTIGIVKCSVDLQVEKESVENLIELESTTEVPNNLIVNSGPRHENFTTRNARAGVPIYRNSKNRRKSNRQKKPIKTGRKKQDDGPIRRQDDMDIDSNDGPGLNVSAVSPIELSLGGLTGLQGLPPLSLIQLVKILVAVTPFMIPLVFVPILIFTLGMFMIPIHKPNLYFGDLSSLPRTVTFGGSRLFELFSQFLRHESCIERLTCELRRAYFTSNPEKPEENELLHAFGEEHEERSWKNSYTGIARRLLGHFRNPIFQRISKALKEVGNQVCEQHCNPVTFVRPSSF